MDDKISPNSLHTTRDDNNHTNEDIGNLDDVGNDNPKWGEDGVASELMNMGTTYVHDAKVQNVTYVGDQNFDGIR
jgi:hypothetical protein